MTKEMETRRDSEPIEILPEDIGKMPALEAAPLLERAASRTETLGWGGEFGNGLRQNLRGAKAWVEAHGAEATKKALSVITTVSFVTASLSACAKGSDTPYIPSETSSRVTEVSPTATEVTPTSTSTPTETPTSEWVPSPEFLAQFDGTAYGFKDNQILFSPASGDKIPIASVENGKFVFSVNGQEMSVDPKLATVPEAKWFLHGATEQIMAVNDETDTYWQYEFDLTTSKWVEKNLPEVSTNINNPTPVEWNDIVGNRWATAIRRAIESGKIPTFGPDVVVSPMSVDERFYQEYGWIGPDFGQSHTFYVTNPKTRPIMSAAYAKIYIDDGFHKILTEEFAIKDRSFGLVSMIEGEQGLFQRAISDSSLWVEPQNKLTDKVCTARYGTVPTVCSWYVKEGDGIITPAIDKFLNDGVWDPILEQVPFISDLARWY